MKTWMLLLTGLILVGCGSNPPVEPDWSIAERVPSEVAEPLPLPPLCTIPWQPDNVDCWKALDQYDIAAEGNIEIAQANADALRDTERAYDALVQAGQAQQEVARFKQELLEDERKQRNIDKWWYRAIIVAGIFAWGADQ